MSKYDINYLIENVIEIVGLVKERVFKQEEIKFPIDLNVITNDFNLPVYYDDLEDDLAGCFISY